MKVNTEAQRHRVFGFSVPLCLCVSILIHVLLAIALSAYLEYAPHPDVLATLDLSSVELSFAEQVEETQPVAPQPAMVGRRVPSPPQEETPPEVKPEKRLPPDPSSPKFPEPKESVEWKEPGNLRSTPTPSTYTSLPAAPRQARLDAPPHPKRNIRPDYPKGARQRGEQGDVILEIRVTAEGTVDDVKVATSSGFIELDEAAVKAAKAAKFSPARSGHSPVASTARLKLQFKLK